MIPVALSFRSSSSPTETTRVSQWSGGKGFNCSKPPKVSLCQAWHVCSAGALCDFLGISIDDNGLPTTHTQNKPKYDGNIMGTRSQHNQYNIISMFVNRRRLFFCMQEQKGKKNT
jgi:hypothetical protein